MSCKETDGNVRYFVLLKPIAIDRLGCLRLSDSSDKFLVRQLKAAHDWPGAAGDLAAVAAVDRPSMPLFRMKNACRKSHKCAMFELLFCPFRG